MILSNISKVIHSIHLIILSLHVLLLSKVRSHNRMIEILILIWIEPLHKFIILISHLVLWHHGLLLRLIIHVILTILIVVLILLVIVLVFLILNHLIKWIGARSLHCGVVPDFVLIVSKSLP